MKHANKLAKSGARTDNSNCSRSSAPSSLSRSLPLYLALSMSLLSFSCSLCFSLPRSLSCTSCSGLDQSGAHQTLPYHTIISCHIISYHISHHIVSYHVVQRHHTLTHTHMHMHAARRHAGTHEHARTLTWPTRHRRRAPGREGTAPWSG